MRRVRNSHYLATAILAAAIALMLALAGCSTGQGSSDSAESATASSASSAASDSPATITAKLAIIHTNDVHGYAQASDRSLGLAAVAQLKKDYEAQGYDVLLVDAGDALQGNLFVDDSKGEIAPELMNKCGYDAMVLGNHEFDFGPDILAERIEACDFAVLGANITVEATGETFTDPNVVFTLSDGTKVGVFGLSTPETMTKSSPKSTAGLIFAQGEGLYACAQQQVDELRDQGCSLIVGLGHLGETESSAPNRACDVIANVEGVDLFIDGHDHKVENSVIKDKSNAGVFVVETGEHLKNIGVVTYDNGTFKETLAAAGEYDGADADMSKRIDAVQSDIDERLSEKVGVAPFELNGDNSSARFGETNLGDFLTDAMRWQATQALGTQPDCAILNGGGIRTSIAAGDVTLRDIHNTYPYSNQIYELKVTGAQLLEALEAACQTSPEPAGSFPQVSGISYTLNLNVPFEGAGEYPYSTFYKPANPGSRVTITDVNGKGFDLDAEYLVATTDFLAYGGDTYYCFTEAAQSSYESTGYLVFQAMQYYLEDECEGTVPDSYTNPQARITIIAP